MTVHRETKSINRRSNSLASSECDKGNTAQEKVKPGRLAHAAGAYPSFRSMKRLRVFLLSLDGTLVHCRSLPRKFVRFPQQFPGTHLYTWVERGTVRVKCLAQEINTMSPDRSLQEGTH